MTRTSLYAAGLMLPFLLLVPAGPTMASSACGDPDDPFAIYYGQQGVGKQWHISTVTPDHEDHGLHLSEGDSFVLRANESCEVILIPGGAMQQRWGASHQQLGRENKAIDHSTVSNELCTTMSLGHGDENSGNLVARPHLVRVKLVEGSASTRIEIRYGHRSTMGDDCSNDGLLDNIHGGIAHAEN